MKAAQNPAEIAGVEAKSAADLGRGRRAALVQFIEHPCFGQRKWALQPAVLQHTEMLGVEAVETAHRGDALRFLSDQSGHAGSLGQLLDGVKYLFDRKRLSSEPLSLLGPSGLAIDSVEALFGTVADDAPVFGTPLVRHAPRLR